MMIDIITFRQFEFHLAARNLAARKLEIMEVLLILSQREEGVGQRTRIGIIIDEPPHAGLESQEDWAK